MLLELLILINLARPQPLVLDEDLSNRATARAEQLYKDNQWSHDGWLNSFEGTDCKVKGENLAKNFRNANTTLNALMNSGTHRFNIINPSYNFVGLGRYRNIIVQLFCGI